MRVRYCRWAPARVSRSQSRYRQRGHSTTWGAWPSATYTPLFTGIILFNIITIIIMIIRLYSTVRMVLVLRPPKIDDINPSKFLIQHTEWFDAPLLAQACKCFDTENAFPHVQLLLLPSRKCFSCLELFHKTFAQSNVWNIAQPFFLRRGHKMLDALGWERRKLSRDLEIGQTQSQ